MAFDPNLPQENTLADAAQMRAQFNGLKAFIDAILTVTAVQVDATNTLPPGNAAGVNVSVSGHTLHLTFNIPQGAEGPMGQPGEVSVNDLNSAISSAISGTSNNTNNVGTLNQSADSSYNQQQMQDVLNKLDEFINAARRTP